MTDPVQNPHAQQAHPVPPVFEPLPIDDPQVRQPDISRARELLDWEPEVELRDGLQRTIEHYRRAHGVPVAG